MYLLETPTKTLLEIFRKPCVIKRPSNWLLYLSQVASQQKSLQPVQDIRKYLPTYSIWGMILWPHYLLTRYLDVELTTRLKIMNHSKIQLKVTWIEQIHLIYAFPIGQNKISTTISYGVKLKKSIHITYILPGLDLTPRTPVTNKSLGWNTKKVLILVLTVTTTWVEW